MTTNPETLRKRKYISNETTEQREARLECERERKRRKRAEETLEQREARLIRMRERRREKISNENIEEREMRLNRERERRRESRVRNKESQNRQVLTQRHINIQHNETTARNREITQRDDDNSPIRVTPLSATTISEEEHCILQNFRNKMDNIRYNSCTVCNERILSMKIARGVCRRCYTEKSPIKKFSAENNMDPGHVPEELKGLS